MEPWWRWWMEPRWRGSRYSRIVAALGSMSHNHRGYMPVATTPSRDRGYMPRGNYASRDAVTFTAIGDTPSMTMTTMAMTTMAMTTFITEGTATSSMA